MNEGRLEQQPKIKTCDNIASMIDGVNADTLHINDHVRLEAPLTPDDIFSLVDYLAQREVGIYRVKSESRATLVIGRDDGMDFPTNVKNIEYFLHTHPVGLVRPNLHGMPSRGDLDNLRGGRGLIADGGGVFQFAHSTVSEITDPFTGQPMKGFEEWKNKYFRQQEAPINIMTTDPIYKRMLELTRTVRNQVPRWDTDGIIGFMAYINGQADTYQGTSTAAKIKHIFEQTVDSGHTAATLAKCVLEVVVMDFPLIRLRRLKEYEALMAGVSLPNLEQLVTSVQTASDETGRKSAVISFVNENNLPIPGLMGANLTLEGIPISGPIIATFGELQVENDGWYSPSDTVTISVADLRAELTNPSGTVLARVASGNRISVPTDRVLQIWYQKNRLSSAI